MANIKTGRNILCSDRNTMKSGLLKSHQTTLSSFPGKEWNILQEKPKSDLNCLCSGLNQENSEVSSTQVSQDGLGWKRLSRVISSNFCNEGHLQLDQAEDHSIRSFDFHLELPTSPCSCGIANVNKLRNCSCRENPGKLQLYLNQKPEKTPEKCIYTSAGEQISHWQHGRIQFSLCFQWLWLDKLLF